MSGFVYCIGVQRGGLVKIGVTGTDVAARLAALQTGNPDVLRLFWKTPGDHSLEAAMHEHFSVLHHRAEWFVDLNGRITDGPPAIDARDVRRTVFGDWIRTSGLTQAAAAAMFGVNQATISKLCLGGVRPGLTLALKIELASHGAVPVNAWIQGNTSEQAPAIGANQ